MTTILQWEGEKELGGKREQLYLSLPLATATASLRDQNNLHRKITAASRTWRNSDLHSEWMFAKHVMISKP